MRTGLLAFFSVIISLTFHPVLVEAQSCVGTPIMPGQSAAGVGIGLPDGATIVGVGVHHNAANNPLSVSGRFEHTNFDAQGLNSMNALGGTLTYDLTGEVAQLSEEFSLCGVEGLMYGRLTDSFFGESITVNVIQIPVGVGFGGTVALGEPAEEGVEPIKLIPHSLVGIYHTRISGEGETESETDFDMVLGGTMQFTSFFFGLMLENLFRDGSSYVTLQAGMIF